MFNLTLIGLAVLAGLIGPLLGATQCFWTYGAAGMIFTILNACGVKAEFLGNEMMNTFLLPAIFFTGAGVATAYAGKKYPYQIKGYETGRSLAFLEDPAILLVGVGGSLAGYFIFTLANAAKLPMDTGALTVVTVATIARFLFGTEQYMNKGNLELLKNMSASVWIYNILFGGAVAAIAGMITKVTGNASIGFYISAVLLIYIFVDSAFPATHHTTMVAGYAMLYTGNIWLAVLFGTIAHLIGLTFGSVFNTRCSTHIDPPAVAIGICSLIIFCLFG